MPSASMETLLACYIMTVLVLSSMVGISVVVHPYLESQLSRYSVDSSRSLAEYWLLNPGSPSNWGSASNLDLTAFGLAKVNYKTPFDLDIDKVTRLNQENTYHVSFYEVFTALGTEDRAIKIRIAPIFDIDINLTSQSVGNDSTVYTFEVSTERSNLPVTTTLHCYVILGDYVDTVTSTVQGEGSLEVEIPNSLNGTALLIAFARAEPRVISFNVYSFGHNTSESPNQPGTFIKLSPLNFTLYAEHLFPEENVSSVKVFTYSYNFDLTKKSETGQTEMYTIPRLLEASPMILVITGTNQSRSFAEWVAYPQLPIDFGSSFDGQRSASNSISCNFVVTINSALYECRIILGDA